jgi:hypothetical protein
MIVSSAVETSFNYFTHLKGKFHPITCHEGTEGEYRYIFTLSSTLALDELGNQRYGPST